jgi:hypothetical protein
VKIAWSFFDQGNKYAIQLRKGGPAQRPVHRLVHSFCG